jgi:hypothetical protein
MKKVSCLLFIFSLLALRATAQSPELPNEHCKVTSIGVTDPVIIKEQEDLEKFTADFIAKNEMTSNCYVIPVVFHVYGTTQGGMPVNDAIIIDAMDKLNTDFHGLNADYGTVHNNFLSIRDFMPDVRFALAEIDPIGNPTTGIIYHPVASGFANGSGYDALIQADAWDNYKYMNIYIQNDLFNDGVTNNSGYAYYPSSGMSDNNTARIVYNGAYLGINCTWEPEFASTLTHEYGHWLNLIHTFDGGCVAPNDQVADTPPCDYLGASYPCHPTSSANSPLNCVSQLINAENYMDYSGASGCYKMFTQGQVLRMYAALSDPSRQPLWQTSNLVATGLDYLCSTAGVNSYGIKNFKIAPNPSHGSFTVIPAFNTETVDQVLITNSIGQTIYSQIPQSTGNISINITGNDPGIYFLHIVQKNAAHTYKLIIE